MASVLIVDDDADIRGLLREVLERASHTVIEAGDGREGLRLFHAEQPDLVILDISMPGFDGWQTLERIRHLSDVSRVHKMFHQHVFHVFVFHGINGSGAVSL